MNLQKLLVISPYPSADEKNSETFTGVSIHIKNTLRSLQRYSKNTSITVLANTLETSLSEERDKRIIIKRVWEKNSFQTFYLLAKLIFQDYQEYKKILIDFDFDIFGKLVYALPLPIFALFLKIIGKDITVIFHDAPAGIQDTKKYTLIEETRWSDVALGMYLHVFYRIILLVSNRVIVLEDILKEKLKNYGKTRKISIIPGIAESFKHIPTKQRARKELGVSSTSFVVLSFGYISWYRGVDWITSAVNDLNQDLSQKRNRNKKKIELIIAGGENPHMKNDNAYQKYIKSLQNQAIEKQFTITGYIPTSLIPLYFQAADLVIFPYRTFTSAYGPLSLAYSFQKPFLLSNSLKSILRSQDIAPLLESLKLPKENLYYTVNDDFKKTVKQLLQNDTLRRKIASLSKAIQKQREETIIAERYYHELFT